MNKLIDRLLLFPNNFTVYNVHIHGAFQNCPNNECLVITDTCNHKLCICKAVKTQLSGACALLTCTLCTLVLYRWLYLCCRSGSQHPSCCLHQSCLVHLPRLQVCTSPLLVFHPCQKPQFRLWCNWPRSLRSLPTHVCWCYTLRWAAWWGVWLQWVCILHYALLLKELSKSCVFVLHVLASYLVRPNTSKLVSSYLSVLLNLN
jgi:hypothetical protein